jgi:hypothetical protein
MEADGLKQLSLARFAIQTNQRCHRPRRDLFGGCHPAGDRESKAAVDSAG